MPQLSKTFPLSGNVKKIDYDSDKKTMVITFNNGSQYKYSGVPENVYTSACEAPSIGTFVAQQIKGVYQYQKL